MPLQTQYVDPPNQQAQVKTPQKPTIITWKDAKMIRWHSLRAAVREILAVSKERDAIRVGIIGDSGTGKTTLAKTLSHLIHTMSEIPFAVKILTKHDLLNFEETIKVLTPTNHVLVFDDISFLSAQAKKQDMDIIKQKMTELRHLPGGQDVKIISILNWHYSLGLDKYLRQTDFKFFTVIGSSEFDNVIKMVGVNYSKKIQAFQRLTSQAVIRGKFSFPLGDKKFFSYSFKHPFIPLLFFNGHSLRVVVSPKREWIEPICSACANSDNPTITTTMNIDEFKQNIIRIFGESHARLAVRLKLFQDGVDVFPKRTKQAMKYIDAFLKDKVYNREDLAVSFDFKDERTRLDVKIPET